MTGNSRAVDLLLLAPLALEFHIALPLLENSCSLPSSPRRVSGTFGPRRTVLVQVGISPEHAGNVALEMIEEYRPGQVLLFGLAGGLDPNRLPGTLILADRLLRAGRDAEPSIELVGDPTPLLEGIRALDAVTIGAVVTVDRMVESPAEKEKIFGETGALAVDMESYTVAKVCRERGVSFSVLRSICDDASTPLVPELFGLIRSDGSLRFWKLVSTVLRKPTLLAHLLATRRRTNVAKHALQQALGELKKSSMMGRHG